MIDWKAIPVLVLAAILTASGQVSAHKDKTQPAAEDISGMYSFLKEGEYVQINVDQEGVSGYISRIGDSNSDRGTFLDQFFSKATVQGHDLAFTTKQIHGVWFEFKGRFDRGPAKNRTEDGYYVLRGTLTEFTTNDGKDPTRHSREVEFKLLGQPPDDDLKPPKAKK